MDLWSFILAGLGIAQITLTGKKKRVGWLIGLLTSCIWMVFAIVTQQYGFVVSSIIFGYIHIKNWLAWSNDLK